MKRSTVQRAERRAASKPARASGQRPQEFVPSMPARAGMEPRHSLPSGDRPMYPSDEGSS